ncbi:MAG: long-chain fatty acid--CoA ligase, partial [Mesorhizobium sp.]
MMHGAVPLLHDYLTHAASRVCDKVALVCGGQRVTYGELEARSNAIAQHLASAGVARGDRVMIFADNT